MIGLYDQVDFRFHVNYHSFGELLLYTFGFQVNTPSADDPIYVALSGTDPSRRSTASTRVSAPTSTPRTARPPTSPTRQRGALAWTPELGDGPHDDGFVFPDKEGQVQSEFSRPCRSLSTSPSRPPTPTTRCRTPKIKIEPFYLNVAEIDPQKSRNPHERLPLRVLVQRLRVSRCRSWPSATSTATGTRTR